MKKLLGVILLAFLTHPWAKVIVYNQKGKPIGTYTSIQNGINACPTFGRVSVFPGTYNEAIYINKTLSLIGIGRPTITAKGLGNKNAVTFNRATSTISGFIITGASGWYPFGIGISCKSSSVTITNNTISGNYDNGISCEGSSLTITNNTISRNNWSGISCESSSAIITNNIISGNNWSGISCESSFLTITNNTISMNDDGISCKKSSAIITNNIISRNSLGIFCNNSSVTITNNTILRNNSHGIYSKDSSGTITNSIITENGPRSSAHYGIYNDSSTLTISYNCVFYNGLHRKSNYYNCYPGEGSISTDPKFIGKKDFRLKPNSPCIDAGLNTAQAIPKKDKDGNPRIINRIVDMGAYEFQGPFGTMTGIIIYTGRASGVLYYLAFLNPDFTGKPRALGTASVTGPFAYPYSLEVGSMTYYIMAFLDIDRNNNPTPLVDPIGIYGTPVIVYSGSITKDINFALNNVVEPKVTVYNPDGTIATYTLTIQAGINACEDGGTISVLPGTYTEAIYISKGIALIGIGTPTITAKDLGNTNTVTFIGANSALISSFIIKGASADYPLDIGIYCKNSSVTITNNIILGNYDDGIYCDSSSAAITNSTISGNRDGIRCEGSSLIATNNIISGNNYFGISYYNSSGTITNNTISGNSWGIDCLSSSVAITNNIISRNSNGIRCSGSSLTITNNTISGNNRHGIYWTNPSGTITNNIITENGREYPDCYGIYNFFGSLTISYNCVSYNGFHRNSNYYNCSPGEGSISEDPQFIGPGDFRLSPNSPCIDAGLNTAPGIPEKDKDQNPRIINGIVDMGAYEATHR